MPQPSDGYCANCLRPAADRPMVYRGYAWCCNLCRKALTGQQ